ncbi:hypothetical protein [Actinophytocola oryzae]|uniref:hypothetical protein n=1 Tax=Actinophytocola oryzae TaxID=502181 RepID=UPI001FBA29A7|nr:hypothetical protein [Actinophytocola oryzae]
MSVLWIPLIGLSVMALLAGVLRWASSLDTDRAHRKDYGLLREVAKVPSTTAARVVEERLHEAGVRATTVPDPEGNGLRILVFPADRDAAIRALLAD